MMLFAAMFLLGGLIALLPAQYYGERRERLKHWQKTKAVIYDISYQVQAADNPHSSIYPRYRFSHEGNEYTGTTSYGTTPCKYKVGDTIEIFFDPSNPAESDALLFHTIGPFTLSTYDLIIIVFSAMSVAGFAIGIVSAILFLCGKHI